MNLLKDLSDIELAALNEIIEGKEHVSELYIYNRLIKKGIIQISEKKILAGCPPVETIFYKFSENTQLNYKKWLSEIE